MKDQTFSLTFIQKDIEHLVVCCYDLDPVTLPSCHAENEVNISIRLTNYQLETETV